MKRYCPQRPFPPYAFIPGKNPHPEKEGGHMFGTEITVSSLLRENLAAPSYLQNCEYLFGIDLFNHKFYWESHVYWEALWHKAGRRGETADFLKALIKLAAASVKYEMAQQELGVQHLKRAYELLQPLPTEGFFFGISLPELQESIEQVIDEKESYQSLKVELKDFAEVI